MRRAGEAPGTPSAAVEPTARRADPIACITCRPELTRVTLDPGREAGDLDLHDGQHPGPADGDPIPLARARRAASPGSDSPANGRCGTKLWQNVPGALVREDPGLALPARPVRRVERVDVEVAAVLVLRDALGVRAEPEDRLAEVRVAAEDALPAAAVRPVRERPRASGARPRSARGGAPSSSGVGATGRSRGAGAAAARPAPSSTCRSAPCTPRRASAAAARRTAGSGS